jgi:hypothetical protein
LNRILHTGSCAAPGDTVYPLAAVVDGGSFTIISAGVNEILAQALTLEVQQPGPAGHVNVCGTVVNSAAPSLPPPPAPPAPAPPTTSIKPPSTGMGPAPVSGCRPAGSSRSR